MQLAINHDDCNFLKMLLNKEEVGTRVEMHHCRTYEYKELLKRREQQIHGMLEMLERIEQAAPPEEGRSQEGAGPTSRMPQEEEPYTSE